MGYHKMGHYIVWHHIWHILVRPMAQRYASNLFAERTGCIVRPYLYAQSANAVNLGSSHACIGFVCFVYFSVEALEEKKGVKLCNTVSARILSCDLNNCIRTRKVTTCPTKKAMIFTPSTNVQSSIFLLYRQ